MIREHEVVFYDRFLKEIDNDWDERPPLELFVLGANEWRAENEWPLARTEFTPWYLGSGGRANTLAGDGTLGPGEPGPSEPADSYSYDPEDPVPTIGGVNSVLTMTQGAETPILPGPRDQRVLERRDDVLCYTSAVLDRDLDVVGPVEVVLYAASSAKDTDWIVRISDVFPNGMSVFMTEGIIRARYRNSARGRLGGAARAGRGGRVPDPLLPDREPVPARAPGAARRDELELPALLAQPEHGRGRRDRDADGDRAPDGAAHDHVPVARRAARVALSRCSSYEGTGAATVRSRSTSASRASRRPPNGIRRWGVRAPK